MSATAHTPTVPTSTPAVAAPPAPSRPSAIIVAVAAIVVAMVGWSAYQLFVTDTTSPAVVERVDPSAELERLARTGQIPAQAYDYETETTRRLTNRGLVPTAPTPAAPVDEAAMTEQLVNRGLVPAETLQPTGEQAITQSLIDRGLVPHGTRP